jgi:hypothetical protein
MTEMVVMRDPNNVLSSEDYDGYCNCIEELKHFSRCVETNAPSPRLTIDDPEQNLAHCRWLVRWREKHEAAWYAEVYALFSEKPNQINDR